MLRVIVVDDEALARQGMRQLLSTHASVQLVGEAGSVEAAADLIRREKPDAMFLDIDLHGDNGFDLLRTMTDPPDVVFVTAHSQHAVKAYEFSAVDYLLKPVNPKRLAIAVAKLEKASQNRPSANKQRQDGTLRLNNRGKTTIVRIDAIAAIRAEGDYTRIWSDKMPVILSGLSLGKIETLLPHPPFVRLGRSLMINTERLSQIETAGRDATHIRLSGCSESFVLGRTAAIELRKRYLSDRRPA